MTPDEAVTHRFFASLVLDEPCERAILVGDPSRIELVASMWSHARIVDIERGYRVALGELHGEPVMALSTGMGGPSLERPLIEALNLGVRTFIRVGTTGALQSQIEPGDLIINEAALRLDGTSDQYVRPEFPAVASSEVTSALARAGQAVVPPVHVGLGATTASYFAGQERPTLDGFLSAPGRGLLGELAGLGVLNFDMETATLFTLARVLGGRAGAVHAVVNNRLRGEMGGEASIELACQVACAALVALGRNKDLQGQADQSPAKGHA